MEYGYTSRDKNGNPRTGANVDELLQKIEDLENATHETAGLMSAADKTKLDAQEASPSIVGMLFTFDGTSWDFGGHTYSELMELYASGVVVFVEIDIQGDVSLYQLKDYTFLLPFKYGSVNDLSTKYYNISDDGDGGIELLENNLRNAVVAHNPSSVLGRRYVTLYGDKTVSGSVVSAATVIVDDNGVAITATNGTQAKYNGSEIATEASIEGGYFAS